MPHPKEDRFLYYNSNLLSQTLSALQKLVVVPKRGVRVPCHLPALYQNKSLQCTSTSPNPFRPGFHTLARDRLQP